MLFKKAKKPKKLDNDKHDLSFTIAKVLSFTLILCILGSIVLSIQGKATPNLISHLAQDAFATLTGMLITRL
ncbi:MAG: hypothetical protein AB4057_11350 [Crocosphaera sp.]